MLEGNKSLSISNQSWVGVGKCDDEMPEAQHLITQQFSLKLGSFDRSPALCTNSEELDASRFRLAENGFFASTGSIPQEKRQWIETPVAVDVSSHNSPA
jgi:hypothetical protein